jgi:hypothetical protein
LQDRRLATGAIEMTRRACLLSVVLGLLLAGCGGRGAHKVAPVSGRVKLDGEPLANATVQFVPVGGAADQAPPPSSVGVTDKDGHYFLVLSNASKTKGAVVGKHKVMITLGSESGSNDTVRTFHKQLPQRYNRKTELECDVPPDGRDDANFDDLKSK